MARRRIYRTGKSLVLIAAFLWLAFQVPAYFLLRQGWALERVRRALSRTAASYGFVMEIGRIRPAAGLGFELTDLAVRDLRQPGRPEVIHISRAYLHFALLGFLRAPRHPEAALVEIVLDRPLVVLSRDRSGAWWWERFKRTSPRSYFRPLVRLRQAEIEAAESPFGRNVGRLHVAGASFELGGLPRLRGWAEVATDLDAGLRLTLNLDYDLSSGRGSARLAWEGATLARWQAAGWLPTDRFHFLAGKAAGQAELTLGPVPGLRSAALRLAGARVRFVHPGWPTLAVDGRLSLADRVLRVVSAEVRAGRSLLTVHGRLDLSHPDPSLSGEIAITRFELAEFAGALPGLEVRGRAGGRLFLGGTLSRPSLKGSLSLSGYASHPSCPPVTNLMLSARFLGTTTAIDSLRAQIGGAKVDGRGRLRLFSGPRLEMDLNIRTAKAQEILPYLGLFGGRGEFDLDGRLVLSPGGWGIDAETLWRGAAWHGKPLPSGRARFSLTGGEDALRLVAAGMLGEGRFEADLRRAEGDWRGEARLEEVALEPLASFLPPAFGDLRGQATAVVGWRRHAGEDEVLFTGTVRDIVLAGRRFDELRANLTCHGTEVVVETGQIRAGGGGASFHGRFDRGSGEMGIELLAHHLPLDLLGSGAGGWIEGRLELGGVWPAGMQGEGWFHLDELAWQGVPLGAAQAELVLADGRLTVRHGRLETADGEMDLAGTIALTGRKEVDLEGRFDLEARSWSRLLPGSAGLRGRVAGEVHLAGTLDEPAARAKLQAGAGAVYGVAWDSAEAEIRWEGNRLSIERGVVRALGTVLTVAGEVGGGGYALSAQLDRVDLGTALASLPWTLPEPFRDISGHATLEAEIEGPLAHPSMTGEIVVEGPNLKGWECERMAGRFYLDGQTLFLPQVVGSAGDRLYTLSGRADLRRGIVALELGMERGDLPGLLELAGFHPPWPVKGSVSGSVMISGRLARPSMEGSLRLEEGEVAGLRLRGEMVGRYDGANFVCERLRLAYEGGDLAATGRLAAEEVELDLEASGLPLGEIFRLFGRDERIEGRGDLRLSLTRRGGTPRGGFRFEAGPGLALEGIALDRAAVEGSFEGRALILTRAELVAAGRPLSLAGRVPLPQGFAPLDAFLGGLPPDGSGLSLKVEGTGVPLALFNPGLGGLVEFRSGELSLAAEVSGTWERPMARGVVRLTNGGGATSLLPDAFSRLNLELALEGDRVVLRQAGLRIGKGWVNLAGSVGLAPEGPCYDLTIKGGGIAYKNPAFFDGRIANLDLAVTGGPLPLVRGSLTVSDTIITVGPSRPGSPRPALPLQVRLVAGRGTKFFLPGMADLPLTGEVQLEGTLAAPTLSGVVRASSGVIFVYGERFEVTSAMGTFVSERGYLPYVELEGRRTIGGTKVFVKIYGEVAESGLTVNLWSEPPLGREEILNLLSWTGLPETGREGRIFASGMELVLETVFGQLSEGFRRLIDVDQFQFSLDERTGSFRLKLGKYVLEDLYLSYEILFDDFGTRIWSFDYRLNPSLVLSGLFGGVGEAPRWTISYQLRF